MPELPEVETIVRGLNSFVPGKTIQKIFVHHPKTVQFHGEKAFRKLLCGKTILAVERQGKFIHFHFKTGESLIVHLRMTGKFIALSQAPRTIGPHVRLVFVFSDRTALLYNDLRIFGTFRVYRPAEMIREFEFLGRDPLKEKITVDWFLKECRRRSIAIKTLLLDQSVLCGLGNIYACEALFRSRISPKLPSKKLSQDQAARLLAAIRAILLLAIKHNGTSVSDYKGVDEKSGEFQNLLKVYRRENKLCKHCRKARIRRIKQAQRSTFFCPVCQR